MYLIHSLLLSRQCADVARHGISLQVASSVGRQAVLSPVYPLAQLSEALRTWRALRQAQHCGLRPRTAGAERGEIYGNPWKSMKIC